MITNQTTLILGAGSNSEYGFPLGKELVDRICSELASTPDGITKVLAELGYDNPDGIEKFYTSLKGSCLDSIDEFLLKHPSYCELAKLCIALILVPCERPEIAYANGWYRYLVNRLHEKAKRELFRHNRLSIITFNYDRSLEYFIKESIRHTYDVKEPEAEFLLNTIDLVHVYGQLGRLGEKENDARPFSTSQTTENIKKAAAQILTVTELDDERKNEIRAILRKSERVIFIGFGYHDLGLERIGFKECSIPAVIGTSVGLGLMRKKRLDERWKIGFPGGKMEIVEFLENYAILD